MASKPAPVTLSPEQLNDTDRRILEVMRQGRVSPQFVADELGVSRPYASERLKRFIEHGHVDKLASGLYELVSDPRDPDDSDTDEAASVAPADVVDDLRETIEALEAERDELRERIDELESRPEGLPDRAVRSLHAARTALEGQSPDIDMAKAELDAVLEVIGDE